MTRATLDAYVPRAPARLADDYDPDVGVAVVASTPATRLLAELVTGAVRDLRGEGIAPSHPRARRAAQADAWAWLHDPTGIDDYGTAAFCCDRLGIDQGALLARLAAGQLGTVSHRRGNGGPRRIGRQRRTRGWPTTARVA